MTDSQDRIHELLRLRGKAPVFRDRSEAGAALADLLREQRGSADALLLAIPAGGVPVASAVADALDLPLDLCVVSKITLPWNTEAGYGAVAFDGSYELNRDLLARLPLTEKEVDAGLERTRERVARRVRKLRGERPLPELAGRTAILIDDGLASGFTLRVAAAAMERLGARVEVAVPTAHHEAARRLASAVGALYCPNLRSGSRFAVADAYEAWREVPEEEALDLLRRRGLAP